MNTNIFVIRKNELLSVNRRKGWPVLEGETTAYLNVINTVINTVNDPILIMKKNGFIVNLNKAAKELLEINDGEHSSVDRYIQFDVHRKNYITQLKTNDKWVQIKVRPLNNELDIVNIQHLSIAKYEEEIDAKIKNDEQLNGAGIALIHDGKIVDCNETFSHLFSYPISDLINMSLNDLIMRRLNDETDTNLSIGIRKDDTTFPLTYTVMTFKDEFQFVILNDISRNIQDQQEAAMLNYYDELTGLPNHSLFLRVLEQKMKNNRQLAVYYVDLDYFKAINHVLGHEFGNKLLKSCANRFVQFTNEFNGFVARVSGDEFVFLQTDVQNREQALQFARSLSNFFRQPILIDSYEFVVSIRIGISIYPLNGRSGRELINHAQSAMYLTKNEDGLRINLFDASISRNLRSQLTLESDLRKAIAEEQFELFYQPQVSLKTKQIVGFEALLRWKHPMKGYIKPLDFIPFAEKTGLIIDIGKWVINEACHQLRKWQDQGFKPVKVSINTSAKQVHQTNFVQHIETSLSRANIDPNMLEIELTESVAMTNEEYMLEMVKKIKNLGLSIAVDDFGTGYSSLKYLSLFPFNKLKIDRMFMNQKFEHNKTIVKSIINLSHSLDMSVTAEGVETEEQIALLKKLNCDHIQGYYISKPLPAAKIEKFLTGNV